MKDIALKEKNLKEQINIFKETIEKEMRKNILLIQNKGFDLIIIFIFFQFNQNYKKYYFFSYNN